MKIAVVKNGRVAFPEIRSLQEMYAERLRPFAKIESAERKGTGQLVVLLDERGEEWSSKDLAAKLTKWTDDPGVKGVTFVIGGPMGHDAATKERATVVWSLSRATFTSDMAWLLVWEQLYRAFNIMKGTAYHHE